MIWMRSGRRMRNNFLTADNADFTDMNKKIFFGLWAAGAMLIWVFIFWLVLVAMQGCSTVAPKGVEAKGASADGNIFDSGVVGIGPDGVSSIVRAHWRDRYNAMIGTYGKVLNLRPDDGLTVFTNGTWLVDREHHGMFQDMNAWRKAGFTVPPAK